MAGRLNNEAVTRGVKKLREFLPRRGRLSTLERTAVMEVVLEVMGKRSDARDLAYRALRDYQEGKLNGEPNVAAGMLDAPLTKLLDRIYELLP